MSEQPDLLPDAPIDPTGLLQADLDAVPAGRWPEFLVRLVEVQEAVFVRLGHDKPEAFRLARAAVLAMSSYFGGRQWYMPQGDALQAALRDAEIYRRAHRGNILTLASEYGLTERHIWRICRQQRKLHLDKIQGRLFEDMEGE
ncbi:transcriptional regulator [Pseudoxanthomonas jiangsuensis]|uniref:Mor transcription activator family protein n=1 Tax=Pseudoxanthomonas jiangsuensis TaxID=619688 RepID=UPI001390A157|nr:Mor transcription activator family protein [Pseudoxanthomonas jiangsuensis]KAF1692742.1 transcriptional regulator [Pseudoxanthomonas jiangsuensis]